MSDIFISYRRGAASPYARGIYERLVRRFGATRVFMDIDTMEPGVDFVEYIQTAVGSCRVLIVVIGPDWVATADESGRPRLHDPDDFVRVEVSAAFERGDVRVIPVLVGGATPPKRDDLPPDLAPLTRRQALEVTDGRWDYDLGVLVKTVDRVLVDPVPPDGEIEPPPRAPAAAKADVASPKRPGSRVAIAGGIAALVAVLAAVVLLSSGGDDGGGTAEAAIPAANPCERDQDGWLVTGNGADAQYECDLETSPPPAGLEGPSLIYGLYGSAGKARKHFDEGLQFEFDNGAESCPQDSLRRMRDVLDSGDSQCFVAGDGDYIAIWWHEDGSRVLGVIDFAPSTKPEKVVAAWERVLSAG